MDGLIDCIFFVTSDQCTTSWTVSAGMHGLGLTRQGDDGQFNEESCKASCAALPSCQGIDYNRQDRTCWFSDQANPTLRTNSQINHWELTRTNC